MGLTPGLPGHVQPGLIVGGKYRLEEEIGKGSMGTVLYRAGARDARTIASPSSSSRVSNLQSIEARKRFSVEAKAAAKLRSRHVVQVYDDGETPEGNPYIVLEYLEGETLEATHGARARRPACRRRAHRRSRRPRAGARPTRKASCTAISSRPTSSW